LIRRQDLENSITVLLLAAASIGFVHTIMGPDHYVPFIVFAKARNWTPGRTAFITALCGLGHVGSSVVLGIIGIIFGYSLTKIKLIEGVQGNVAAWLLVIFGFIYFLWGVYAAIKNKPHTHKHFHKDGKVHQHPHVHNDDHKHPHDEESLSLTPWVLFTIFVLGPCEPMIPLLFYPAAEKSITGIAAVSIVFGLVTISTMVVTVLVMLKGINLINLGKLERYTHAFAGLAVLLSGLGILLLGL